MTRAKKELLDRACVLEYRINRKRNKNNPNGYRSPEHQRQLRQELRELNRQWRELLKQEQGKGGRR